MDKIKIDNICKMFQKNQEELTALDDVTLDIEDGQFVCLLGPSGCGKTTLLNIIAGFNSPDSGSVKVNGKEVTIPGPDRGYVFQEYALFPWMTIAKNIEFGLLHDKQFNKAERKRIVQDSLEMVGLSEFENNYPHTLSGGMKQRAAIARALAPNPDILLMDEPFGALDAQTRRQMQTELVNIWQKSKKTVVFVTHSIEEAVFLADVIVLLSPRPGRIHSIDRINIPRFRDINNPEIIKIKDKLYQIVSTMNNQEKTIS